MHNNICNFKLFDMKLFKLFLIINLFIVNATFGGDKIIKTIIVDGIEREFIIHKPASYDGNSPVPLVFMLHGTSGDGERMYETSGWAELAETEGFIAVFPSSLKLKIIDNGEFKSITKWNTIPDTEWTLQPGETAFDDIKFLRKVIDEVKAQFKINSKRIYLNGFSNGGQMAAKCSIEMSDLLAAVCSNAGSFYIDTIYTPKRKIPYLYQVGNKDYGPGNIGPEFPAVPMHLFDSLLTIPGLNYQNGKHYRIVQNVTRNFSLKSEHTAILGDTNFAVLTTYQPVDNKDKHEFVFVFVKNLAHNYPDWAPAKHWEWMKKYTLDDLSSTDYMEVPVNRQTFFYPNPAEKMIKFTGSVNYKIIDQSGRIQKQGTCEEADISGLANGVYIIKVGTSIDKLVICR